MESGHLSPWKNIFLSWKEVLWGNYRVCRNISSCAETSRYSKKSRACKKELHAKSTWNFEQNSHNYIIETRKIKKVHVHCVNRQTSAATVLYIPQISHNTSLCEIFPTDAGQLSDRLKFLVEQNKILQVRRLVCYQITISFSVKKDWGSISASTWKALQGAYHHSERSTTASGRQVHLPWKHIV